MININNMHVIAIVLTLIAIKIFIDQRQANYDGPYKKSGIYQNITWVKHDVAKCIFIETFLLLVFGLGGKPFFDKRNILNSWVGKVIVMSLGYFVYHLFIQPYAVNYTPEF